MNIPAITTEKMVEVDRLMIEVYQISLMQMMENAGRNLADCAQNLTKHLENPSYLFLIGSGNNGGGGLVASRHLINRGFAVQIKAIKNVKKFTETAKHQWTIIQNMGAYFNEDPNPRKFDLIIDAMVGYGLMGQPRGNLATWIEKINAAETPVLSLDVPSGLDATNGMPFNPCTRAAVTLTLALPKRGLMTKEAKPFVGELYLADISVPKKLYESLKIDVGSIFKEDSIIRIR